MYVGIVDVVGFVCGDELFEVFVELVQYEVVEGDVVVQQCMEVVDGQVGYDVGLQGLDVVVVDFMFEQCVFVKLVIGWDVGEGDGLIGVVVVVYFQQVVDDVELEGCGLVDVVQVFVGFGVGYFQCDDGV